MNENLLRDLLEADAQGIRFLISVWPQDLLYHDGEFREVLSLQRDDEFQDCLIVRLSHEGRVTTIRRPEMHPFPVLLSDHHAASEANP
jgi:hypothetical protein